MGSELPRDVQTRTNKCEEHFGWNHLQEGTHPRIDKMITIVSIFSLVGPTSDHSEMFAVSSDRLAHQLQNPVTICLENDAHSEHKARDFAINKSGNKSCF